MSTFIEVVYPWVPFLLLVSVFIWTVSAGSRARERDLAEAKRHNAVLEEILRELKSGRVS